MGKVLIFIGALVFCAHLFATLFSRRRIPDVLFLVMIGIIVGPVLGWVTPDMFGELGMVFASLTLVVILADSGMDMHVLDLKKYWLGMVQVTTFSFLLSMVVASVVAHYMAGMNWISSILLSGMIAGTGASIVIPMVKQMKVSEKTRTVLSLESAISAVLCIVVTLAILQGYSMGEVSYLAMVFKLLASLGVALILGVVGGLLWSGLLGRVRTLKNSMFLTPAFVIILYGIAEWMGYSGAIAALAFGIVLGNVDTLSQTWIYKPLQRWITPQPLKDNERSFIKEIVFLVKTFFFVYIGISIPFTDNISLLYGLAIAAALFVARFILIAIVGHKNTRTDRLTVSIMIPKGLAAAVLAPLPKQINMMLGREVIPYAERIECIVYAVIFFSIIICSLLVLLLRHRLIDEEYHPEEQPIEVYDYE